MIGLFFLLLLAIPVLELWVIVQVAHQIGLLSTLAILVLVSAGGAWLLRQQGTAAWERLQATLRRGEMPTTEVTDGALILLGGALLLTPGFVTDAAGLVLLLPPTRAAFKNLTRGLLGRWARRRMGLAGRTTRRVYPGTVVRTRTRDPATTLPPPPARPSEDDSPDTG